jgi:seryl-tRNA synthetase
MARRRRAQSATSLDLFLDTICNAFGGIMFISILISILVQMRGDIPDSQDVMETITAEEAESLQSDIAVLQAKIEAVTQSVADRERILHAQGNSEVRALQEQLTQLRQQLAKDQAKQAELVSKSTQLDQSIQAIDAELKNLDRKLQDAQLAVSERSTELQDSLDAMETTTTLPKVADTQKGNLLFAFRYGRLYLLSDVGRRYALGVNEEHATAKKVGSGVEVRIKKQAGWDLQRPEDAQEVARIAGSHPASTTFFAIAVFSDSFPQFLEWKKTLISMGYDYDLIPFEDVESFTIGSTSSARVQ